MKKLVLILCLVCVFATGCKDKNMQEPNIEQIRSICNLATLEAYYHNVAKSTKEAGSGLFSVGEVERKFWIEYTGIAKIGIDMSEVSIDIKDDKVTIYMPDAKLLSVDILEEDLNKDSYIHSGDSWFNKNKITAEDQTKAINNAQKKMEESVMNNSALLLSAQTRAKELIENYIVQLGDASGIEYKIEWKYSEDK